MGFLVPRIVVVFANRPFTIRRADWPAQLIEKVSNVSHQHDIVLQLPWGEMNYALYARHDANGSSSIYTPGIRMSSLIVSPPPSLTE